jgi:hypothetical protein
METDTESLHQDDADGQGLQGDLFGCRTKIRDRHAKIRNDAPIAAKADPVTSLLAEENLTISGARSEKKKKLLEFLLSRGEPLTSFEISRAIGWDRHETAKRLPDARADGLVENGPIRECRITGRPALTWQVVRA